MNRIKTLRSLCLERKTTVWRRKDAVVEAESLKRTEHIESWLVRRGELAYDWLTAARFEIDDLEILAGRMIDNDYDSDAVKAAESYLENQPFLEGQTGHCELDFGSVFEIGLSGIVKRIETKRDQCSDQEKIETYGAFLLSLEGLKLFIQEAALSAEKALRKTDCTKRRNELQCIVESCNRIAEEPPASFRDAIQLMWLVNIGVTVASFVGPIVPGHIDRTLWPFLKRDLERGVLDQEDALELVEQLYLLINEFYPDGTAISVMIGGVDKDGSDVTNTLSYLALEALRRTNLVYPTVGICWHDKTPEKLTGLAVELIAKGYTTPAFFGDDTIQKGLKKYGVPTDEACNYINSTCVEITLVGSSNIWVASPYISVCKFLNEEIANHAKAEESVGSFQEFFDAYIQRLDNEISKAVSEKNRQRQGRRDFGGKPLQSVFTKDCIEKGIDIDRGGATYNWCECSFVGLANLADSLMAIKCDVFEEKNMTLKELKQCLDDDFKAPEPIQERLANYPKYGNNNSDVDGILKMVTSHILKTCEKHKIWPAESHFIPGAFCWVMHERLGKECGATPDGRYAGTPFADGGGPAQGREKEGPTSAILSTTCWDHSEFIGGVAMNMKFDKSLFKTSAAVGKLKNLIITFLKQGGFEVQVNVLDREILKKAEENPEHYKDLVVRIGGYTDYFTRLSPGMRQEVINRTGFSRL